jgi:hypothetical protein
MGVFPVIAAWYHGLDARVKDGYFGRAERNPCNVDLWCRRSVKTRPARDRHPCILLLDEFQHRLACDFGDVNGAGGIDCHPVRSVQALNPVQHLAVFRADG